jgi:6-phosphogluconolactonase
MPPTGRGPHHHLPGVPGERGEPEILVGATPVEAARLAAEHLVAAIAAGVARRGRADVATTGGSTCPELYRALLARPVRDRIAWNRLHVWFGDDRFVRRDSPDSNLVDVDSILLTGDAAAGLEPAPLPPGNLHPVTVDATLAHGGGPAEAAAAYEAALRSALPADAAGRPIFDAILVGIGPDGHLLSIFPGSAAFDARGWVVAVPAPTHVAPHVARVSLTPGALDATPALLPMAFGTGKAAILASVLTGPRDERRLPAQRARRAGATWILDAAAAGMLPRS